MEESKEGELESCCGVDSACTQALPVEHRESQPGQGTALVPTPHVRRGDKHFFWLLISPEDTFPIAFQRE